MYKLVLNLQIFHISQLFESYDASSHYNIDNVGNNGWIPSPGWKSLLNPETHIFV